MKRFTSAALLGLGILAVLYAAVWLVFSLSPSVNDRDLRISRETLAAEDNGFEKLQSAARQLWWPRSARRRSLAWPTEADWNDALVAEVLAKNQQALTALDAFDGQPLRYLPEEKMLYSIGEDLQDDHGAAMESGKRKGDYPFPLRF